MQICVNTIFLVLDLRNDLQIFILKNEKDSLQSKCITKSSIELYHTFVAFTFSTCKSLCGNELNNYKPRYY